MTVRLLFTGGRGAPVRRDGTNAEWRRALLAAGITPDGKATGWHQLRHHYASLLIAAGVDVRIVAARLGHHAAETFSTYTHLINDEVDRTADIIAAAHVSEPSPVPLTEQRPNRGHLRAVENRVSAGQRGGGGRVGL